MNDAAPPAETDRPAHVLLVDDDLGDYEATRAMLGQIHGPPVTLSWASSYDEAVDGLTSGEYDLFLVDYFLEDRTGLEFLAEARERRIRTPIIMLTGRGSRSVDLEAMRTGAADYLVKGSIDPDVLERTIRYALARAEAEEALRASEARHREMFDHLPIGLYRCTPEGGFLEANPALVRLLDHPENDVLHDRYARNFFVAPGDLERFREQLEAGSVVRAFETWLTRPDGKQVLVRNTARAHRDPGGGIAYVEGAVEDVTEQDRVLRVREEAARFRSFMHMPVHLLVLDPRGRILEASPTLRETLGRAHVDLLARPVTDLVAEDDRPALRTALSRAAAAHGVHRFEVRLEGPEGREVWARATLASVRDDAWEVDQLLLMLDEVQESAPTQGS
jgi:PAS domain S-box-containing protein